VSTRFIDPIDNSTLQVISDLYLGGGQFAKGQDYYSGQKVGEDAPSDGIGR